LEKPKLTGTTANADAHALAVVGLILQSGYALLPSQAHHSVSPRLTRNLILFAARQWSHQRKV